MQAGRGFRRIVGLSVQVRNRRAGGRQGPKQHSVGPRTAGGAGPNRLVVRPCGSFCAAMLSNGPMSQAEYDSKPMPVLSRLAAMLRNIPSVQLVLARFARLLRGDKGGGKSRVSRFADELRGVAGNIVDRPDVIVQPVVNIAFAVPESDGRSERKANSQALGRDRGQDVESPRRGTCFAQYSRTSRIAAGEAWRNAARL